MRELILMVAAGIFFAGLVGLAAYLLAIVNEMGGIWHLILVAVILGTLLAGRASESLINWLNGA